MTSGRGSTRSTLSSSYSRGERWTGAPSTVTARRVGSSSIGPRARRPSGRRVRAADTTQTARMRASSSSDRERLREIVVGARLEPGDLVALVAAGRQDDDRRGSRPPDPADDGRRHRDRAGRGPGGRGRAGGHPRPAAPRRLKRPRPHGSPVGRGSPEGCAAWARRPRPRAATRRSRSSASPPSARITPSSESGGRRRQPARSVTTTARPPAAARSARTVPPMARASPASDREADPHPDAGTGSSVRAPGRTCRRGARGPGPGRRRRHPRRAARQPLPRPGLAPRPRSSGRRNGRRSRAGSARISAEVDVVDEDGGDRRRDLDPDRLAERVGPFDRLPSKLAEVVSGQARA